MLTPSDQRPEESFRQILQGRLRLSTIPALDGLRAVAVFLVIFHHLFGQLGLPWPVPGQLGVLVFFVLSGFLITWLLLSEEQRHGKITIRSFYQRRILRIFPAFYVFWGLSVGMRLIAHREVPWNQAIAALLYVSNYYQGLVDSQPEYMVHTWSLAVEEQFYLLWPFVFASCRGDHRRLTRVTAGLIGLVWVHRALLQFVFAAPPDYIRYAFDTRLDNLLVGCLLAILIHRGLLTGLWRLACSSVALPLATIGLLAVSTWLQHRFGNFYGGALALTLEPIIVAVLLVQAVVLSASRSWSWLDWGPVRYLGKISYSLYLYHGTQYGWLPGPVARAVTERSIASQMAVALMLSLLLASASYWIVERPFLKLKSRVRHGRESWSMPAPEGPSSPLRSRGGRR